MSDQQQTQTPSSSVNRQIVGSEGLGLTISAVAQQVSALEKSTAGEISAVRTETGLYVSAIRTEIARVEQLIDAWHLQHEHTHRMESEAVKLAFTELNRRSDAQNEWRAESQQRQSTYPTKGEIGEIVSRLETIMLRDTRAIEEVRQSIGGYVSSAEFRRFEEGYQQRHTGLRELVDAHRLMWSRLQGQMFAFTLIPTIVGFIATILGIWAIVGN